MTQDQLDALKKVDEILNDVCLPTYSKLASLIRDETALAEDRLSKFRAAVKTGAYTTAG